MVILLVPAKDLFQETCILCHHFLFRVDWLTMLKEPACSFLGPDRKMFLQSFSDHDVLGQAFEDALEVLQQHSDREMQCPPGNKHPYSTSFPSS